MTTRWVLATIAGLWLLDASAATEDYSILRGFEAESLVRQCSRSGPSRVTAFWIPSPSQVAGVEARLSALLRESGHKVQPSESYRQYIGLISEGKRLIYVSAFARSVADHQDRRGDWRSHAVIVCDGGDAFWGVEFDPATGAFHNLRFNGVA